MSRISHIFISGAQSVGKTTLARKLNEVLTYKMVDEAARRVILEEKYTKDDLNPKKNPKKVQELNLKLLKIIHKSVIENLEEHAIFDRGLDPLVYAKFYLGKSYFDELLKTNEAQSLIENCRNRGFVFIVTPHVECMINDEIRTPISMEELNNFTKEMKNILDELRVKWTLVEMLDLNERVKFVLRVLKKFRS